MLFNKKITLIEPQSITVGEFNREVDGAYDNMKTFPLQVKKGKKLFVSVKSDNGVDVCVVGTDGINMCFKEAAKDQLIGPLAIQDKGTAALILGVYRGDLAHVEFEAWME